MNIGFVTLKYVDVVVGHDFYGADFIFSLVHTCMRMYTQMLMENFNIKYYSDLSVIFQNS